MVLALVPLLVLAWAPIGGALLPVFLSCQRFGAGACAWPSSGGTPLQTFGAGAGAGAGVADADATYTHQMCCGER